MDDQQADLLSEALGLLRITGSVLLVEGYTPPWAMAIPDEADLAAMLHVERGVRIGAFHFVYRGSCTLSGADRTRWELGAGEVIVAFGGLAHTIMQGDPVTPLDFAAHLNGAPRRQRPERLDGQPTALICGVFLLRDTALNPVVASLPPFVRLDQAAMQAPGLSPSVPALLGSELARGGYGSAFAVHRLLELLCVESIRGHIASNAPTRPGWFCGLRDPVLSRALVRFHQCPGEAWSVRRLAAEAHLSPSRFAARFTATVGESCMSYVTRWRLTLACNLLRSSDETVDTIAHRVGYVNVPAFTRIFRRYVGTTPATWRKQQLGLA